MIQRVHDLEEEIARVRAWEEQKKRYKLVNPWEGAISVVYALKESCKGTEPPHWICTKCYDDGRRTILQLRKDQKQYVLLVCPTCKSEIHTESHGIPSAIYSTE